MLLDVKRGDIGSTSQAYADAYLDPASPMASDAVTVSPFLGFGSLDPFVETARTHDAGLFVLALTSNKEGPEVQHARTDTGESVADRMLDHLRALNAGAEPLGSFGAVVGATIGETDADLHFNGPILAPGFGAQGGTVDDIRRIFGSAAAQVAPSSSREVLRAGPSPTPCATPYAGPTTTCAGWRDARAPGARSPGPCWRCSRRCCSPAAARTPTRSRPTARGQPTSSPTSPRLLAADDGSSGLLPALPVFERSRRPLPTTSPTTGR